MNVVRSLSLIVGIVVSLTFVHLAVLGPSGSHAATGEGTVIPVSIDTGRDAYHKHCGHCHMSDVGMAVFAPPLSKRGLSWFQDVETMYAYVSTYMPLDAAGSLTPEEYWAAIAFMLNETGLLPEGVEMTSHALSKLVLNEDATEN